MSKRGENIRKREDGRWESRLLNKNTGKYKYFYGKTYGEVKRKRYDFLSDTRNEKSAGNGDFSEKNLSFVFEIWLTEIKGTVKNSTYSNYENIVRLYLIPMFGNIKICEINSSKINGIFSEFIKSAGLSAKYIHDILSVFKAVVSYISKHFYPINIGEIISISSENKAVTVLSEYEQSRLVRYLLDAPDYSKMGVILCLYTGMRIGEICALKWSDIRLKEGYIEVSKTMYRIKNIDGIEVCGRVPKTVISVGKPKTFSSERKIPICDFMEKILSGTGEHCPGNYFLTDSGDYVEPRTFQNRFKKYLQGAEIQAVNFHALRHTFATNCVNSGCDVKSVSEILGHSSVKITLDKYVHPSMSAKKNQLDKLAVYGF
ncbi:MAG: site-specific integrase [Ruminococcus sp.]|nr:site-specific integrase [Ruminococcus sp.]MCM1382461.1 site-specific integrase [Muribaculaceae bacterium]MCM1478507.1 site-specific integrase [Muribaculaceae bacterium]